MPTEVIMPQMGESIFEGTITKWLKKPGDQVQRDEPLFEISTDKVDAEIPSPAAGTLTEIKVGEGTTVQINTVVAVLSEDGTGAAPAPAAPKAEAEAAVSPKAAEPQPRLRPLQAKQSTWSCRRWASRSLRAPLRSGSRKSATPLRRTSLYLRFRPTKSMPRFLRRPPAR